MAEYVEGDFKNFVFKMIQPQDFDMVLDHLARVFYTEELLFQLVGCTGQDVLTNEVHVHIRAGLEQSQGENNLSFYAVDKTTNKIAGVRLNMVRYKNTPKPAPNPEPVVDSPEHTIILKYLAIVASKANFYERFNVDNYAELMMTSVEPEFRCQGLVTEFYVRSLRLLQARGFPVVKCTCSSPYTLKAVEKLGFYELDRLYYAQAKNEDGSKLLPNATDDQVLYIMAKKLN